MNDKDRINYWVDLAKYDMETAKAMLVTKRFLYVGFMCHQAIEKILKAYFVYIIKGNPIHTHRLTFLTEKTGLENELNDEQKDFIDEIEPLNIEARYPTYKEKLLKRMNKKNANQLYIKQRSF